MVFQVAFVMADRAKGLMKHLTSVPLRFQVAFYTFSFKASQVMSDMQLAKGYLKKESIYFSGSLYLAYAKSRLGLNFSAVYPVLNRTRIVYAGGGRRRIEQHDNQRLALHVGIQHHGAAAFADVAGFLQGDVPSAFAH